jgi:hypothetical protein
MSYCWTVLIPLLFGLLVFLVCTLHAWDIISLGF